MEFDLTNDYQNYREKRALNIPFKLENGAYAVFVKGPNQEILRIEFNKSQASSDPNNLGPKTSPIYWSTKLALAAIEEPEPTKMSLNDIANYYTTKKGPCSDWDGKFIADRNELFRTMPELKNAIPSYTLTIPGKEGGKEWFPDAEPNKLAKEALDKQTTPYSKNRS